MNIKNWSTTAASNNATPPDGFPEGQSPSTVNDSAREMMAALRTQHENAEWIDYGYTLSYISSTSFVLDGDRTTQFHAGRRVKAGVGTGNVFGTILSASYSTKTGVTISLDSGNLDSSLTSVAVGIVSYVNTSKPDKTASYAISAGSAIRLLMGAGTYNNATGSTATTSISGIAVTSGDFLFVQSSTQWTTGGTTGGPGISYSGVTGQWLHGSDSVGVYRPDLVNGQTYRYCLFAILLITQTGTLTLNNVINGTSPSGIYNSLGYAFLKKQ